ncbi:MAG: hypothetical protein K1X87_03670 [Dehalococcoidia bacterium]|nr:hypothetical protein [Dehalococcoidia bacterium]HRC61984.1 hypothetical protein [Dehalococcoidia bacterium]
MDGEAQLPPFVFHGTPNAYTNYGCRCDACREAHSLYRSERRARDPAKYTTYMREYMRKYRARKRQEREALCANCGEQPSAVIAEDGKRYCLECAERLEGIGAVRPIPKPAATE